MPSSVIESMRYDPRWRVVEIAFRGSGEVYRYFGVPRAVWEAFLAAPSKGTFLNETFKAMGFRYERAEGQGALRAGREARVETWPREPAKGE